MLEDLVVPQGAVAIHWFGQSWYAFKNAAGLVVQVDPYGPRERPAEKFIHAQPPVDEATLRTDYVLLTHDHGDHTCIESLLRIHAAFPAARFYGPRESMARLRTNGIPEALLTTIAAGETQALEGLALHAVWAKPPAGVPEAGIPTPDVEHLGFVLEFGGRRIYISGDPINTISRHEPLLAAIRAHAPQIGLLTTHPSEGEFPFFAGSVEQALKLGLEAAVPAHYDCFVQRTYDPQLWAAAFPADGPRPIIIPYNGTLIY
jgi:L-ascorbate metabolism protein UlaG (beta-lactamase superfamily)